MTKQYIIYFESKVVNGNNGYFYRNRKVGFSAVFQYERAKKFKTEPEAFARLKDLKAREGEYYNFEIKEIYI